MSISEIINEKSISFEGCALLAGGQGQFQIDNVAEWSKALDSGSSPQGRGFESHRCHFYFFAGLGVRGEEGYGQGRVVGIWFCGVWLWFGIGKGEKWSWI